MLRLAVARGTKCAAEQPVLTLARLQWQLRPSHVQALPLHRSFADARSPDKTVLPGTQSSTVAGVPQPPILNPPNATAATKEIPLAATPKEPPTPAEVAGKLPPSGPGSASTGPSSTPPPKKPRRRFRNFLLTLIVLSALGYAGGVYYSLVSDNFHDFFTEYVPFGEDAVAYFEEREFRKRFPQKEHASKTWAQTRGEHKVTIGRSSGLSARVAESSSEDLGQRGRHVSAIEDNNKPKPDAAQQQPAEASPREKTQAVESAKKTESKPKAAPKAPRKDTTEAPKEKPARAAEKPTPAPVSSVSQVSVDQGNEPIVQHLVSMVNNVITAVNASPEASKLNSTVENLKSELNKVIGEIGSLKSEHAKSAEDKIQSAHAEFDTAAKELVRRLEREMQEQESKWQEEYEQERERLSASYQQKLAAELDVAKKVAEQKTQNSLIQQEIALQKQYMESVKSRVEEERSGRLSKLEELSSSVSELEKLTGEWNDVLDTTLQTQHLQVAVEAVKAKVLESEGPQPFLNELVALKEVSKEDDVVSAAIASINPVAYQRGIPTAAHLIDRFRRVASEVRKASLLPEDAGVASHAASAVLSRLMFQKKADRGLPEGDDVEATLARTEVLLEEGDLDAAAREMNGLKGWAGVLSKDWVGECRRVLEVRQAVDVMSTEARLKSLLVG